VLVEHWLGDAGAQRDVVHRGGVEAALGEHVTGDVEQLSTSLVSREPHGAPQRTGGRGRARAAQWCQTLDFNGIT
jgi:hypothetical protein